MDVLFEAIIVVNGQSTAFRVYFDEEVYCFQHTENNGLLLQLYREKDEWHTKEPVDKQTRDQAIQALDNYLLSQH